MKYVGLTDDPVNRKQKHGDPSDWWQKSFPTEEEAREWEEAMLSNPCYRGGPDGEDWKYGYTYSITDRTRP